MLLKRRFTRLSLASISPLCFFLLRFLRTVLLSHLLLPNDLGAAVALMSILAGCEIITDVGLDRFVMVSRPDDRGTGGGGGAANRHRTRYRAGRPHRVIFAALGQDIWRGELCRQCGLAGGRLGARRVQELARRRRYSRTTAMGQRRSSVWADSLPRLPSSFRQWHGCMTRAPCWSA